MSAMIYSSAHHAQTVDRFKERLRNGSAVDVLDDNGRWRRARVTQIDTDWGKCKVKFDGVSATQEEWVALSRDRVRQPGEMTHAQNAVEAHSAAFSAHASAASELRKERMVRASAKPEPKTEPEPEPKPKPRPAGGSAMLAAFVKKHAPSAESSE